MKTLPRLKKAFSYLPAMPSCPFITPGRKLGLGLAAASLLFGATAHAQLYVNDPYNGTTEYSLDGTEIATTTNLIGGSQGMGVTDGSVYVSQFNYPYVFKVNPTTLATTYVTTAGTVPNGGFTAGGGLLYVDDGGNTNGNASLTAYNAVTGNQDGTFSTISTAAGSVAGLAYTNGDLFVSTNNKVNEYNGSTGAQIGSSLLTGYGAAVLAADGNLLYLGDGTDLYSYNLTSDTLSSAFSYQTVADLYAGAHYLAATSDALFVSDNEGSVLKFDLNSDGTIDKLDTSFAGGVGSVPAGAGAIAAIDIPEPSSTALIILGTGSLLLVIRRRGALSS